jgi:hypothetical protein
MVESEETMSEKAMITQTLDEWMAEGKARFGEDLTNWKFKCPACGHVASGQDFKDVGADTNDMYSVCIGRKNGKGVDAMKSKDKGNGCNWAAFGLFRTLGKGRIVLNEGKEVDVFDFAD